MFDTNHNPESRRLSDVVARLREQYPSEVKQRNDEFWAQTIDDAEANGDGLDYDGPLTWA